MARQDSLGIGFQEIAGRRIAVLGGGSSGRAAAALALKLGAVVEIWDSAEAGTLANLPAGLAAVRGGMPEGAAPGVPAPEWCVVSPGVPTTSPLYRYAQGTGAMMLGELEFAAAFCTRPLIGITGTNGKTTTTELLTACLNACGVKAVAAGNIGLPLSQLVADGCDADYIVLEISSFQLEHCAGLRLMAGVILNITPDHLDRHGSLEAYTALKASLARLVLPGGTLVCPAALTAAIPLPAGLRRCRIWLNAPGGGADMGELPKPGDWAVLPPGAAEFVASGGGRWSVRFMRTQLQLKGNHNLVNLCAAAAIVQALKLPLEACQGCIGAFRAGAHRIQRIATVKGVDYYDDSKATDVDALVQALRTVGPSRGRRVLLIAGGLDKGCTLEEAKTELRMYVKSALLIGQCRRRLADEWRDATEVSQYDTLEAAVQAAANMAQEGDAVLLSPGCASMDMFRDYVQRGVLFAQAVQNLPQE